MAAQRRPLPLALGTTLVTHHSSIKTTLNTPTGKIGRLPEPTRNELNQHLADGESAAPLLQWFNARPGGPTVLAGRLQAEPVSESSLRSR